MVNRLSPSNRSQIDEQRLAELIRNQLGERASVKLSPIGTGKHNSSYWVRGGTGLYVLRVAPAEDTGLLFYERRMMRQEPRIHEIVRSRTEIPIAEVVISDFSNQHIPIDYILLTALPGKPLSQRNDLSFSSVERALYNTGRFLRQLHDITVESCFGQRSFGYLGEHHPMEPQPTWLAAFRVMWNKLLDDIVSAGCYTDNEADSLRDLYEKHLSAFERPVESRLLHMDIWSENILVDGSGTVTGLVDFDRALWGDREIEFAVLDYCGISEPAFWEGYATSRDESDAALVRRQFYLLYEVQKYMPIEMWRHNSPEGALRYKQSSLHLARELGLRL